MARHRPSAVGIDFGTSTSLVARRHGSEPPEILAIGVSRRWLPSLFGRHNGHLLVGEDVESLTPEQVVRSIKRAITLDHAMVTFGDSESGAEVSRDEVITEILREVARRAKTRGLPLDRQRDLR